ncbi:GNAT family N-acetyltransferase [Paenarthrobacter sp. Z7-10]|uniref:GNAT family N-acetyltransferase n=1 Tax=Paenarthrobacter sp. Z7-10 TaxID=2787635 RepID=UPI0022A94674|nr:GNAT family N-acetyltransferase [Paenarthrobacter sp. Z7-10]MCZ2403884.1 GNAT family N-acetyltransferase [Paenarthrobacter sp. Z7-10]
MLEIRPAALAELSLLPAIEAESDTLLTALDVLPLTAVLPPGAGVAEFSAALHILVAGRPPVAFARLEELDGQAHLEQLSVHPDWARQGIGRALVHAAVAWARESGYRVLTLSTFADVRFNAPFYMSCGFVAVTSPGPELQEVSRREVELGLDKLGPRVLLQRILPGVPEGNGAPRPRFLTHGEQGRPIMPL